MGSLKQDINALSGTTFVNKNLVIYIYIYESL